MAMILSMAVICYSMLAYSRNFVWKDELTLWNDVLNKSPHKYRPYYIKGLAYIEKRDIDKVIYHMDMAIKLNPKYALAYYNRAVAYYLLKNYQQSWVDVKKSAELGYAPKPEFLEGLKKASGREK